MPITGNPNFISNAMIFPEKETGYMDVMPRFFKMGKNSFSIEPINKHQ